MRTSIVVCSLVFALGHPASADDTSKRVAAVKAMFAAQRAALIKDDEAAFRATLTADALVGCFGDAPSKDFPMLSNNRPSKLDVIDSRIGWTGTWGWVAADVRVTSRMYAEAGNAHPTPEIVTDHWLALVVADGDAVKTKVMSMMTTAADSALTAFDEVQKLKPIAGASPLVALLAQPLAIAKQLSKDPATSVPGSSETDRGLGVAAAKQLIGGWAKLTLEVVDAPPPLELGVGDARVVWAKVRFKLPSQKWVLLQGFAIARKLDQSWELVGLEYGPG